MAVAVLLNVQLGNQGVTTIAHRVSGSKWGHHRLSDHKCRCLVKQPVKQFCNVTVCSTTTACSRKNRQWGRDWGQDQKLLEDSSLKQQLELGAVPTQYQGCLRASIYGKQLAGFSAAKYVPHIPPASHQPVSVSVLSSIKCSSFSQISVVMQNCQHRSSLATRVPLSSRQWPPTQPQSEREPERVAS